MEFLHDISTISLIFCIYFLYKFIEIRNKSNYFIDLAQRFSASVCIEEISAMLISEIKKKLKAPVILFNEYTFTETKTITQIPTRDIIENTIFPSHQFLILKELLEKENSIYFYSKNFNNIEIKKYFPKFQEENFILIPIYANNYKILTVEIFFDKKIPQNIDSNYLSKIIEIYVSNYKKLDFCALKQEELKKEELVNIIIDKIKNIFDEETMMYTILQEVSTAFRADRCYFITYYKNSEHSPYIHSEYVRSPYAKSIISKDLDYKELWEFFKSINMTSGDYAFERIDEFIEANNLKNTIAEDFLKRAEIKSYYPFKVFEDEKKSFNMVIQFTQDIEILKKEDLKKIDLLIKQIKIALYQAKLYTKLVQNSEREKLMIDLIGILRSSLDINNVINDFINKIGYYFNATRCIVRKFNEETHKFSAFEEAFEYKKNFYTTETKNTSLSNDLEKFLLHNEKFHDVLNINYSGEFFKDDFEYKESVIRYFEVYKINSFLAAFVRHNNRLLGFISMHFSEERDFSKNDEEFLKAIAFQVGAALYQSNLYTDIIKKAEKEKLLKNILNDVRSIQDKPLLLNYFVRKLVNSSSALACIIFDKSSEYVFFETQPDNQNEIVNKLKKFEYKSTERYNIFYNDNLFLNEEIKTILLIKSELNINVFFLFDIKKSKQDIDFQLLNSITEVMTNSLKIFENNEKVNSLRETFLATLSHDLQVPLIAERNALEFILKKLETNTKFDFKEIITNLLDSNVNLTEMLKTLLEIYRIEAKKINFEKTETDISKILEEIEYEFYEVLNKKGIILEKNLTVQDSIIFADSLALKNAIKILIKNAILHISYEKKIKIVLYKENKNLILCISVEGSSLTKEMEKIIFERNNMSQYLEREIGEGLPIYLAKLLIEGQNGELFIKHSTDRDLTFCIAI